MNTETFKLLPLTQIHPSAFNPRKNFEPTAMAELKASIVTHGVLQPIVVRHNADGFEIVAGERRWRAAKEAGLEAIPAMVHTMSDEQALEVMIIENAKRADVHPLEEARAFHDLQHKYKHDVAKIAERVGRSVAYVYDRMKLLSLTKELQTKFLAGEFTAGHAVILARLTPEVQKKAADPNTRALFEHEVTLWTPGHPDERKGYPYKARSVRELQAWVDEHVKFDPAADDVPMLFPETAAAVSEAKEEAEKVISITHDHMTPPAARDGQKVWTCRSWKRADGKQKSKPCEHSITGIIVIGAGRGEAFKVCTAKEKCTTHWGAEQREKAKRAKASAGGGTDGESRRAAQEAKWEEERKQKEAARARWQKATPALIEAINAAIAKAPTKATGQLADILVAECTGYRKPDKSKLLPRGSTAEDLVRHLVSTLIAIEIADPWRGPEEFPKTAKAFGIDVRKVLDEVAPVEKPAAEAKPAAAKKPAKSKAKKK